jgi:hypothetical protein
VNAVKKRGLGLSDIRLNSSRVEWEYKPKGDDKTR